MVGCCCKQLIELMFHVVFGGQVFIYKSEYMSNACVLDSHCLSWPFCRWLYFTNKAMNMEEHMLLDGSNEVEENCTGAVMTDLCGFQYKQLE